MLTTRVRSDLGGVTDEWTYLFGSATLSVPCPACVGHRETLKRPCPAKPLGKQSLSDIQRTRNRMDKPGCRNNVTDVLCESIRFLQDGRGLLFYCCVSGTDLSAEVVKRCSRPLENLPDNPSDVTDALVLHCVPATAPSFF